MRKPRIVVSSVYERISHTWYPKDETCHAFGTLNLGPTQVHLYEPGQVDEVIAELVALRAEMTADTDPPGCICDIASADQCPVHRSEPATAAPELTVRERAQRGARKAAEREAAATEFTTSSMPGHTSARCLQPGFHSRQLDGAVVDCDVTEHHAPAGEGGVLFPAGDEDEPARVGVPEVMPVPQSHYCDSGNCEVCGDGTGDGSGITLVFDGAR